MGKFVLCFFYHNKIFLTFTLKFDNTQCWTVHRKIGTYPHPINSGWDFSGFTFCGWWFGIIHQNERQRREEGGRGIIREEAHEAWIKDQNIVRPQKQEQSQPPDSAQALPSMDHLQLTLGNWANRPLPVEGTLNLGPVLAVFLLAISAVTYGSSW